MRSALSAKIIARGIKTIRPMLTTRAAVSQAIDSPFFNDLVNIGIKAEEKVPNTNTSKIKSGSLKAAKKSAKSSGRKKWARTRCLTNPKILEATTINIITPAADITLD